MKKIIAIVWILLMALSLCAYSAFGQTVDRTADKNFKGRMTVGTDTNAYIPTPASAWLQIGEDSTDKGFILPRVVDTGDIDTPAKGMFVFQNKDSTIYYYYKKWLPVSSGSIKTFIADTVEPGDTIYRLDKAIKANAFHNDSTFYNEGAVDLGYNPWYLGLVPGIEKDMMGAFAFRAGVFNRASGTASTASGYASTASGDYSTAMGVYNTASGYISTAIGNHNTASGITTTAIGDHNTAIGSGSTAMGVHNTASGYHSTAIGYHSTTFGYASTAFGYHSTTYGKYSTAFGDSSRASGYHSTASGYHSAASAYGSMAIGFYNDSLVSAETSFISGSPIFIVGNGSGEFRRHNAYVLFNNGISTQYGIANYSEVSTGDFTDSTLVPKSYVDSLVSTASILDTALNGLTLKHDSVMLGGVLTENTTINGSYDLNINTGHFRVGNPSTDVRTKMVVVLDTTGSAPNTALGSSYKSKDPDLSLAYGYNGLYGVSSITYSAQPNPTSEFTYIAAILGKFNIPESPDSFTVNSTKVPASGITSVVQTQNGNTSYSDLAWFVGGSTQSVPAQPAFTGHVDTAYGLYLADIKGQDAISDSIRRAYGVYVNGSGVYNYFAGHAGFGINTSTSAVDINGTTSDTGADLLRVRKSYTPTGSADTNGETGSIAWDDDYVYVKTSTGWKRAALTTF